MRDYIKLILGLFVLGAAMGLFFIGVISSNREGTKRNEERVKQKAKLCCEKYGGLKVLVMNEGKLTFVCSNGFNAEVSLIGNVEIECN